MRRRRLSSTSLIRSYNATSILRTLHAKGACTRAELARATGISPATVSRIVNQLAEAGLVQVKALAASSGGRRPALLEIDQTKLHVVGVELRRDQVAMILVNLRGEAIRQAAYPPGTLQPEALVTHLAQRIHRLIEEAAVDRGSLLGVGLAVAGVVNRAEGRVVRSVNLGWAQVPLAAQLEERLELPVLVENDANAAALSEVWFGQRHPPANLIFLKTEAGVGAGIVLEHQLFNGPRGMAGEIGHIPLIPDGHPCRCGQRGCLETYVNVRDVLKRYTELTGREADQETFFRRAAKGEPAARALVEEARQALTLTSAHVALLLDVEAIFIGGVWGAFSPAFVQEVEAGVQRVIDQTGLEKSVRVHGASLGADADLMGATGLVIDSWLTPHAPDRSELVRESW